MHTKLTSSYGELILLGVPFKVHKIRINLAGAAEST